MTAVMPANTYQYTCLHSTRTTTVIFDAERLLLQGVL